MNKFRNAKNKNNSLKPMIAHTNKIKIKDNRLLHYKKRILPKVILKIKPYYLKMIHPTITRTINTNKNTKVLRELNQSNIDSISLTDDINDF